MTPEGFLHMYGFSMLPDVVGIFAVLAGSGLLASDEENGRLDLIMAHSVSRASLFWGRLAAFAAATTGILVLGWLGFVAYATKSGSTFKVAQALRQELAAAEVRVDVHPVGMVDGLGSYDAVIVGGPMIMGWHREAVNFVVRHQQALNRLPVAYFLTALSLMWTPDGIPSYVQIFQDPSLAKPPRNEARLSFTERYATVSSYLQPALKKAP